MTVYSGSISCSVNVTIIPNRIKEIVCNSALEIIEGTNGTYYTYWDYQTNSEEMRYYYDIHEALRSANLKYTVRFNDGTPDTICSLEQIEDLTKSEFSFVQGFSTEISPGEYSFPILYGFIPGDINVNIVPKRVEGFYCLGTLQIVSGNYTRIETDKDWPHKTYQFYDIAEALKDSNISFLMIYDASIINPPIKGTFREFEEYMKINSH